MSDRIDLDLEEVDRKLFSSPRGSVEISDEEFKEAARRLFIDGGPSRPRSRERDPDEEEEEGEGSDLAEVDRKLFHD